MTAPDQPLDAPPTPRSTTPGARFTRRQAVVAVLGVALLAVVTYLWAHWIVGPHHHQFDLRIYYSAVNFWTDGHNIYRYMQPDPVNDWLGFTYPPLAAVLMSPMAILPLGVVKAIALPAIITTTAVIVWLSLRDRFGFQGQRMLLAVAVGTCLAFWMEPIRETLGFGQINTMIGALIMLDVLVLRPRGSRWTGVGIGLAMAVKITPGIFLLYLLLSKQWRATATAVVTAAVTTLLAAVITPVETWQYYTTLLWDSSRVGYLGSSANQSLNGLLARFLEPGTEPSRALWLVLVIGVLALTVVRTRKALAGGDHLVAMTLVGMAGVLISPASWYHHMVWVIPAVVVLARVLTDLVQQWRSHTGVRPEIPWAAVCLALPALLIVGFDTKILFGLPDVDYTGLGWFPVLVASLPMWWALATIALLPIRGDRSSTTTPALSGSAAALD
ncbi:glycosyltransferase 87 family protein [Nakamurella alba]|uniref:glycosyltransferase 87 family protein n=1 Tax=Nakamurella alba TaxID=2665158 RepID=UPI0018A8F378|nr:glycosyltransferase 87 family protein [Nakamurella alba]